MGMGIIGGESSLIWLGCLVSVCVCQCVCPKQDIFNTRHLLLPCPDAEFSTRFLLN